MAASKSGSGQGSMHLEQLFRSAVTAALPNRCLRGHWPPASAGKIAVLAIGKAATSMAAEASLQYGDDIRCLVLRPDTYILQQPLPPGFRIIESSHPFPDERSVMAADAALNFVTALDEATLLLVLMSGGGSSVMCKPRAGLSLAQKQTITRRLQDAGASIAELNCVRKQLSAVKGGRLAAATHARIVTLAISDVPGDDPSLISSGPTINDPGTSADALEVLARYRIPPGETVLKLLSTPSKPIAMVSDPRKNQFTVVANGNTMLEKAKAQLETAGYRVLDLGDRIEGNAGEIASRHAIMAITLLGQEGRHCILSGGESTVTVHDAAGTGGRNTEYLLALACALEGAGGIHALACDSDGIDGNGDHAGAVIGPDTLKRAADLGMDARDFLRRHDSATFFEQLGDLVVTGPLQTNVNDFRVIVVAR